MTSIDLRCIVLLGTLVAGCATGTPRPASGVPPAPVEEYRATSAAQAAFDRVSDVLAALEVQYTTATATTDSADRRLLVLVEALRASRAKLAALPNPAVAQIVFAGELDRALDRRLRELAVEQKLLLARVRPEEPEAKRIASVITALRTRRETLHAQQATLYAAYRAEPTLSEGEWIRLTLRPSDGRPVQRAQGRVLAIRSDSLFWEPAGLAPPAIGLPPDASIERVVSRRSHPWEGALVGLVTGSVIGRTDRGTGDDEQGLRGLVFGAIGTVIGAFVGSTIHTEKWAAVRWANSRVVAAPSGAGLGIQWRLPERTREH